MDRSRGPPRGMGGQRQQRPSDQYDPFDSIPKDLNEDDDNANAAIPDITDESGLESEGLAPEDPLENAIDDLEGRLITALDEFKLHPGTRSSSTPGSATIHEELSQILSPVLEVAAHLGPSQARRLREFRPNGVDQTIDEIYRRINSDLVLPVVFDVAQSDRVPAKRAAALQFFHRLYKECRLAGSYLDATVVGLNAGPYGEGQKGGGGGGLQQQQQHVPPQMRALANRRKARTSARRAELLRYWVEASAHCTSPGTFTNERRDDAVAARAILSASSALRPALRHVADRISSADDAGATRLYRPMCRMIAGVLRRLFVHDDDAAQMASSGESRGTKNEADGLRSASVKFLEIVVACFSTREQPGGTGVTGRRRGAGAGLSEDFALEDLPTGHPIITRESLDVIGAFAFNTLRGLVLIGGQLKIDPNLLPDMMSAMDDAGYGSNPAEQILDLIKPAALTFLEVESSTMEKQEEEKAQGVDGGESTTKDKKDQERFDIDRSTLEIDFPLSQKSYSLSVNALSMLAANRPTYFRDAARALAWRAMDPPTYHDDTSSSAGDDQINTAKRNAILEAALTKVSAMAIRSQLKASCLTLLRNTLSVTAGGFDVLHLALVTAGMQIQADKALKVAKQQAALRKAGRAARNRAAIFYEWESAADERSSKRQKHTDDALAEMRSARAARGLGGGIQLPTSMTDACELILLNIDNLPEQRPSSSAAMADKKKKRPSDLESLINVVLSNGASLATDKGTWYSRDGGEAWTMEVESDANEAREVVKFALDPKAVDAAVKICKGGKLDNDAASRFDAQRAEATSEAFSRLVLKSSTSQSKHFTDLRNQIASRLAWTLRGVHPSADLQSASALALGGIESLKKKGNVESAGSNFLTDTVKTLDSFSNDFPLVSCCIVMDMMPSANAGDELPGSLGLADASPTLSNRTLTEAYMQSCSKEAPGHAYDGATFDSYDSCLNMFLSSAIHTGEIANAKPNDLQQKRAAAAVAASLPKQLGIVPSIDPSALKITSLLCDIEDITKKSSEAAKKTSDKTLAASASLHAAKVAAVTRANQALFCLRDVAFQRSSPEIRSSAVDCAVGIAAGRLPASAAIEGNALKLVMNVLYEKSPDIADCVVASATEELEQIVDFAVSSHDRIQKANAEAAEDGADVDASSLKPNSDEEKIALERISKTVILYMAIALRKPEIISTLLKKGSREKADVLSKAIRTVMPKLARAVSTKYGSAKVALQVADMVGEEETDLFLAFLDSMTRTDKAALPKQDLIDACYTIQNKKAGEGGKKDPRFIIPVLPGMTRDDLGYKLSDFVASDNEVFKRAMKRMSERLSRHALVFRDQPDKDSLRGMTLCEQIVFLHQLNFAAVGLPQKRYLDVIRVCLDDDAVFTDRVIMAALDYISGIFLSGSSKLPLAYMRTIILTCSKHETLHSWICHVLLPRLIEGKVYEDKRQWEGWMRCAKMLENTGEGVSSLTAIEQLPEEQLRLYRAKYPKKE